MQDYADQRFDIALSGISVTADRLAVAAFSVPYHRGGKTPIVRCGTQARFDTLGGSRPARVRAIVNPGGTNERFAREHLTHAHLTVHPDNRSVFDEIVQGRADVMVTDDIEVELQTRRRPALPGNAGRSRRGRRRSCCHGTKSSSASWMSGSRRNCVPALSTDICSRPSRVRRNSVRS